LPADGDASPGRCDGGENGAAPPPGEWVCADATAEPDPCPGRAGSDHADGGDLNYQTNHYEWAPQGFHDDYDDGYHHGDGRGMAASCGADWMENGDAEVYGGAGEEGSVGAGVEGSVGAGGVPQEESRRGGVHENWLTFQLLCTNGT
jgi:hypothetical protein